MEEVQRWQLLRYGDETSHGHLEAIQSLDVERRRLLRELNANRTRLHALQRSMKSLNEKGQLIAETKLLKQEVIPKSERNLQRVEVELDKTLPRVANCVIALDVEQSYPSEPLMKLTILSRPEEIVFDPLYCLRGYETLPGFTNLTGTGAALAHSLSSYALHFCRTHSLFSSFSHAILPSSINLESSTAQSLMGCSPSGCLSSSTIAAPPWVAASLLHDQKTYYDRQLPLGQVISTTTSCSAVIIDEREEARLSSFRKSKRKSWIQLCPGQRIELLCLTGNTISESNAMQREMTKGIVEFHQSLLVNIDASCEIRLRAVEPPRLLPCEASRVAIEGIVGKSFATLGYVSNMTDYSTRACKTKIGGTLAFCHTVHGVLCGIPGTIEWMLQHNVLGYNGELGVAVPPSLSCRVQEHLGMTPEEGILLLPFVRRIQYSMNGKVKRTERGTASKPRVIQSHSNPNERHPTKIIRPKKEPFVRGVPVTAQDIENERLSCPFDFLPIG